MSNQKCTNCGLVGFATDEKCRRCDAELSTFELLSQNQTEKKTESNRRGVASTVTEQIFENSAYQRILVGFGAVIGGIGLGFVNFGGKTYVFYGLVVFGVVNALKGCVALFTDFD